VVDLILGSLFDELILMVMCVVFVKQEFGKFMGIGKYFVGWIFYDGLMVIDYAIFLDVAILVYVKYWICLGFAFDVQVGIKDVVILFQLSFTYNILINYNKIFKNYIKNNKNQNKEK